MSEQQIDEAALGLAALRNTNAILRELCDKAERERDDAYQQIGGAFEALRAAGVTECSPDLGIAIRRLVESLNQREASDARALLVKVQAMRAQVAKAREAGCADAVPTRADGETQELPLPPRSQGLR